MKGVYMFFADGFEETEALAAADVIKRGGIDIKMVSIYPHKEVSSAHNVTILTDMTWEEFKVSAEAATAERYRTDRYRTDRFDVMIFPGGMPGSTNLADKKELMDMMLGHYDEGGVVAAICAAPSVVLGLLPDLKGMRMTCYDGFEPALIGKGVRYSKDGVVVDGQIITGRGAGHAISFGLEIVAHIKGRRTADEVKRSIML